MSNEKEYCDIFESNRELLEAPCAPLLNAVREKACTLFKDKGFPTRHDEAYRKCDINSLFATDYGMNLGRIGTDINPYEVFKCDVPNLKTCQEFIVNDSYRTSEEYKNRLPQGVLLGSLNEYARTHAALLEPYYNTLAASGDSIVQFNTMFAQDGMLLYIPRNTEVSDTIQLVTILRSDLEMLCNRRLLIILEENAKASLLVCDHASDNKRSLSTQVTEVFIGRGASLDIVELEETDNDNTRLTQMFVRQHGDSRFNHCNITLTNGFTRNSVSVSLEGEGAECNLSGLVISDKRQYAENHTLVEHKAAHCTSNELYKYVLDEESTGVFAGKMLIHPDAQQTISQQTNRNLCLTSCAHMYAQPQLEIYADDVKCSHGSTVGQLDENAMFYMQQRGIPAEEARHLLMFAFAEEVIGRIGIEALRDRLHMLIEKRFRGELNRCKGCRLCK